MKLARMPYLAAQVAEVVITPVAVVLVELVFLLETAGELMQTVTILSAVLLLAVAAGDQRIVLRVLAVMASAGC